MLDRFKATLASVSSVAKLVVLQLRGVGDEGDDGAAEPADDAVFLQQLGIAARPVITRTLRALGFRHGDEVWALKVWDKTKTPTDLAAGETRVFAAGSVPVRIRLLADGSIHIDADGADVVVNGGSLKVARDTDPVRVTIPAGVVLIGVTGGGGTPAVGVPNPSPITLDGTIQDGAPRFKG